MARTAAGALGEMGDGRAVESLIGALQDRMGKVCEAAAIALGQIGDERRRELLTGVEALRAERNRVSKGIGKLKDKEEWASSISIAGSSFRAAGFTCCAARGRGCSGP
jgi:HEAT repeat protein